MKFLLFTLLFFTAAVSKADCSMPTRCFYGTTERLLTLEFARDAEGSRFFYLSIIDSGLRVPIGNGATTVTCDDKGSHFVGKDFDFQLGPDNLGHLVYKTTEGKTINRDKMKCH